MYCNHRKEEFLKKLISKPKGKSFQLMCKTIKNGWGEIGFNHGVDSDTINLYGRECSYGIGMHSPAEVELYIKGLYTRLTCFVGQESNRITNLFNQKYLSYKILGDGKELWLGEGQVDYHSVDIDITGVQTLTLMVYSPVDDNNFGHVAWGDLTLYNSLGKELCVGKSFSENRYPLSFCYGGEFSGDFLYKWDFKCERVGGQYKVTYQDPETGLALIIDIIDYNDDAALWWDVYFENKGEANTKQISQIKVLDYDFEDYHNASFRSAKGSTCLINDFEPICETFKTGETIDLYTENGRSTNHHMPYFNINGKEKAVIGAMGWSGQWRGRFTGISPNIQNCAIGLDDYVDFYLTPGEKVQVPSMSLVFSDGDFEENQNDFRGFLVDHIIPEDKFSDNPLYNIRGKQIKPAPICVMGWGGMRTSEYEKRIEVIKKYKLPYEYYWMDAGWYGPEDSYSPDEHTGDWAMHVGNWQVNPKAHPKGLRYLSDKFAEIGLKFLLWVEPQRAVYGTPAYNEHPEFWLGERKPGSNLYLNLSDDRACDWLIDFISGLIEKFNIKCFREDYNFDPLAPWRDCDQENRRGITEIKAVNNGYRFWKTLLERFPDLIIDNCASGGRRLDINMAKLSFSLWRTDYQCFFDYDPIGTQLVQNWLSPWNINNSTGTQEFPLNTFRMRACMATGYCMHLFSYEARPVKEDYPFDWHRRMLEDYIRVRPYFYGKYYSLIPAKFDYGVWISYEMYRDDLDEGCVFVFREEKSNYKQSDIVLKGINPDKTYIIEDLDDNSTFEMKGSNLLEKGFEVSIPNKLQSKLYVFKGK